MALLGSPITQAADHLDSTSVAGNPMGDINDVFAWLTEAGANLSLAMTVSPFDDGSHAFGPDVQYVWHLTRHEAFPQSAEQLAMGEESKVVCTFESDTSGECWVIDTSNKVVDYVKGDFSATTGVTSADGKLKVFAGRRSDPFFFNLAGFLTAQKKVEFACGGNTAAASCPGVFAAAPGGLDAAGCPSIPPGATIKGVRDDLSEAQAGPTVADPLSTLGGCPANQKDCFADANVMAIAIQLDKALIVNDTKTVLGVWGSTHAGQ